MDEYSAESIKESVKEWGLPVIRLGPLTAFGSAARWIIVAALFGMLGIGIEIGLLLGK